MFAYRHKNLKEFREAGAKNVCYYVLGLFQNEIIGTGRLSVAPRLNMILHLRHYEDDGRLEVLESGETWMETKLYSPDKVGWC